jgi:ABC-type spermidine/putrescine transport system permease subunit II
MLAQELSRVTMEERRGGQMKFNTSFAATLLSVIVIMLLPVKSYYAVSFSDHEGHFPEVDSHWQYRVLKATTKSNALVHT